MAKQKFNRRLVLAKTEDTYGTDAAPDAALNAILTKNLEINPIEGEELNRELDKGTFGNDSGTLLGQHAVVSFEIEMAGAGTAGDLPAYDPVLRAAGHAQSEDDETTPTEIYYDPIDDDVPSLTLYFHGDKTLHKCVGSRGSLTMTLSKRAYGYMRFEFMCLIEDIAAGTMPDADTSAFTKPIPFRESTVDFSLFGDVRPIHSLTINGGQEVSFYETSENETLEQEDRSSTWEATIEHPDLSVWDIYADIRNDVIGTLELVLGTTGGNIFQVNAGEVQMLNSPSRSNENGIVALGVGGSVIASSTSATTTGYRITVK